MAEFPIEYTDATVSGRGPSVRANIDVSTGAGAIGAAVAGLGGAMFQIGMKIRDEQDLIEESTLKRQINETGALGIKTVTEEPDDTKHEAIIADYTNQINSISGKSGRTNRNMQIYKDAYLPRFAVTSERASNRVKIKNMDDESRDTLRAHLESGNQDLYNDTIAIRVKGNLQSKEQGIIDIRDFRVNTNFAQSEILIRSGNSETALAKLNELDDTKLTVDQLRIKNSLKTLSTREEAAKFKLLQDATGRQMLADLWDGKLKDPQDITDAVRSGLLSDTDGKYLRKALMSPEPPTLNLQSLATVKQAIEEIGTNTKTAPQALSVLYAHLDSIDPTTGKTLVNEIFSEQEKNKSEMKRESRALMEELVRDRDKFTGMFTDDERQILAAAEAYLMLDAEIGKAVKAGKPLERRDIMIKAIQIGRQMKAKIKQEKADRIPPEFSPVTEGYPVVPRAPDFTPKGKPIIKGAITNPDFALNTEGEPEKVFDSKGRETGLRRKSGAVFEIGYHAIFSGKKYEYTGNGNWKLVK